MLLEQRLHDVAHQVAHGPVIKRPGPGEEAVEPVRQLVLLEPRPRRRGRPKVKLALIDRLNLTHQLRQALLALLGVEKCGERLLEHGPGPRSPLVLHAHDDRGAQPGDEGALVLGLDDLVRRDVDGSSHEQREKPDEERDARDDDVTRSLLRSRHGSRDTCHPPRDRLTLRPPVHGAHAAHGDDGDAPRDDGMIVRRRLGERRSNQVVGARRQGQAGDDDAKVGGVPRAAKRVAHPAGRLRGPGRSAEVRPASRRVRRERALGEWRGFGPGVGLRGVFGRGKLDS